MLIGGEKVMVAGSDDDGYCHHSLETFFLVSSIFSSLLFSILMKNGKLDMVRRFHNLFLFRIFLLEASRWLIRVDRAMIGAGHFVLLMYHRDCGKGV